MKRLSFVVALLCLGSLPAISATQNELTLSDALQHALRSNPELQNYDNNVRAAEALIEQANLSPNPRVGVELENFAGSGRNSGFDNSQLTVSFSQLIELGNKQQQRVNAATAEENAQQAEYEYQRVQVLAQVTQRFYRVLQLQGIAHVNAEHVSRTQRLLHIAQERVKAGAVPTSEVTRIRLQLEKQQANTDEIAGQLKQARAKLSAMWAQAADFREVSGTFHFPVDVPAESKVLAAVNDAPEVLRLLESERLLTAQTKALESDSTADVTLGVGARYNNQFDDVGLVVQASMPLQWSDPNIGRIQQSRLLHKSNLEQQKLVRDQLRSKALALLHSVNTHDDYLQTLTERLLPLSQQLLEQTQEGYGRGTHSLLQVLDAQTELAQLEYEAVSRKYAIYSDMIQLERLTGQPFFKQPFLGEQP